jgi:tetratricopeptide (TPR) repeat protein
LILRNRLQFTAIVQNNRAIEISQFVTISFLIDSAFAACALFLRGSVLERRTALQITMKTKILSWLTVVLSVVASIFLCESIQAQDEFRAAGSQRAAVDGGGGGSTWPSSAGVAIIRQQQAAAEAAAEQQRRNAAAYAQNEQGLDAYKKKDWATAEAYFKQSLQNNPNDSVVLRNLAQTQNWEGYDASQRGDNIKALEFYRQALANDPPTDKDRHYIIENMAAAQQGVDYANAEVEREKQQQIQDKASANDMKDSLSRMVNSLSTENNASTAGSKTPDSTSAESAGLAFTDTDPALNNAFINGSQSGQQQSQQQQQQQQSSDTPSNQKVTTGTFGDKVVKPGVLPAEEKIAGTGNNNAQQALDALNTVKPPENGGRQQVIDTAGPQGKDITPAIVGTPTSSSEIPDVGGMDDDKVIKPALIELKKWLSQSQQDKEEVIKKQAAFDQANPNAKKAAQEALDNAQIKSQGSQQMVISKKKEIVERMIYLKPFTVSGAVAPAPAQNQPPAPVADQGGTKQKGN